MMTNRKQYILFQNHDDPDLVDATKGDNVLIEIWGEVYTLHTRDSSIGIVYELKEFTKDSKISYNRYQNKDVPDLDCFIKQAKKYILANK